MLLDRDTRERSVDCTPWPSLQYSERLS